MSKKAVIRDLQAELASRNRDLWILTDQNADLRMEIAVLEAVALEQEKDVQTWQARATALEIELAKRDSAVEVLHSEWQGAEERAKQAGAENAALRLHWQREAKNANSLDAKLEQVEDELAALKAQRCRGCRYWTGKDDTPDGVVVECRVRGSFNAAGLFRTEADFCCQHWSPT